MLLPETSALPPVESKEANVAATTLHELIQTGADANPALSSPGGVPLSFQALRALTERSVADLNARGIGRGDRVAIVLPNGPEMAAAFIAVAAGTTSAPLNPSYKADEFEFYMSDLGAKLLLVAEGSETPAVAVAEKLGVSVARLRPTPDEGAGSFTLHFASESTGPTEKSGPAGSDDIALVCFGRVEHPAQAAAAATRISPLRRGE